MVQRANINRDLYNRYTFFKREAGYCVGHRAEGALRLARAERWAEKAEASFSWEWDQDGDLGDHAYWCSEERRNKAGYDQKGQPLTYVTHRECDHEILYCLMDLQGEVVASLSGIIDADHTYRRVVEAELALEAWDNWKRDVDEDGHGEVCICDNCQASMPLSAVEDIQAFWERVDIGGVVPAGECPHCGALCYLQGGYVWELEQKVKRLEGERA